LKLSTAAGSNGTDTFPEYRGKGEGRAGSRREALDPRTGVGMNTEGALQEMVQADGDVHVQPGVAVLQDDLVRPVLRRRDLRRCSLGRRAEGSDFRKDVGPFRAGFSHLV
jgi:hypothetical protein